MRVLMVGAGATGGFYGGLLVQAGRDVTFLLRERRASQVRQQGFEVQLHTGERLHLHPAVLTAAELREHPQTFDLIVLSTKSYQLGEAMNDIAPAVGPATMILPILNGMAHLDELRERFGPERVLGGTVRVVSDLLPDGRIVQMTSLDEMSYGELAGGRTARIEEVERTLSGAGFSAYLQEDIMAILWQKWWILASMGTICILAQGTVGAAASVPYGAEIAHTVLEECTAVAAANGYPANPAMLQQHRERFTDGTSALTTSLYRDLRRGAPTEADHILGDLIRHAKGKGVPVPLVTAAYVHLKVHVPKPLPTA